MLCSVTVSDVSRAAAIQGSAEFFAPLIETRPRKGFPPVIRNLSTKGEIKGKWLKVEGEKGVCRAGAIFSSMFGENFHERRPAVDREFKNFQSLNLKFVISNLRIRDLE